MHSDTVPRGSPSPPRLRPLFSESIIFFFFLTLNTQALPRFSFFPVYLLVYLLTTCLFIYCVCYCYLSGPEQCEDFILYWVCVCVCASFSPPFRKSQWEYITGPSFSVYCYCFRLYSFLIFCYQFYVGTSICSNTSLLKRKFFYIILDGYDNVVHKINRRVYKTEYNDYRRYWRFYKGFRFNRTIYAWHGCIVFIVSRIAGFICLI